MIENGFVYAVNKAHNKKVEKELKSQTKKEKAYETIKRIQNKYNFCFGYMTISDTQKMNERDKKAYYKAIKITTTYADSFLKSLGLC